MSLLGRLGALFGGGKAPDPAIDRGPLRDDPYAIMQLICAQAREATTHWQKKLSDSPRWLALKDEPAERQIAVMLAALTQERKDFQTQDLRHAIIAQTLRRDLPFTTEALGRVLTAWSKQPYSLDFGLPGRSILGAVERLAAGGPAPPALHPILQQLRDRAASPDLASANKSLREIAQRIDALLHGPDAIPAVPAGAFGQRWDALVAATPPAEQAHWQALAVHALSSAGKAQPTAKWLAAGAALLQPLATADLPVLLPGLLADTTPDPDRPDDSLDLLKGLIWLTPQLDHATLAGPVGRFAEVCFRKVPNHGARSLSLGNAALWALSAMADGPHGAAELFRLGEKVKYPSARRLIAKRLAELADASGQSLSTLEDIGLPDHGLDAAGRITQNIGDATATISLTATTTSLTWADATGKPLKSVPAAVRAQHKSALAAVRKAADDVEAARAGQVARLEASWVERRDWALADWQAHYLAHPLRRPVVQALIWDIAGTAVLPQADQLTTLDGSPFTPPAAARVRLWHPLLADPATVLAWRARIEDTGLTQPIRQAHREIYVLTDAERRTETYSNRFAAHILRQHQLAALARTRGWNYQLMGQWDSWSTPERPLPAHGLTAEYMVQTVDNGEASTSGILLHVATDQLRFVDGSRQPVPLASVDPLLLSEVMRDCDLFVAVTSVANDPGWADGGPQGRFGQYWREWAFGDLGQSAATRRALIARLAPRLSIAAQLEIGDRSLIVTGKRHRYAIHFGSSNIQILPSNRYLCIVPDSTPAETRDLALPFAGDNLVSIILAKAFLLADEDKITDRTILSQL